MPDEKKDGSYSCQNQYYRCPKHGLIIDEAVFFSHIPEYEGTWCIRCFLDVLNANPVIHRVTDLAAELKEEDAKSKSD